MAKKSKARKVTNKKPSGTRKKLVSKARVAAKATKVRQLLPANGQSSKRKLEQLRAAIILHGVFNGSRKSEPLADIQSAIAELKVWPLTKKELNVLLQVIDNETVPVPASGGVSLRYRIEIAAAYLATLISCSYECCEAVGIEDPDAMAELTTGLAVRRAREIWAAGGA